MFSISSYISKIVDKCKKAMGLGKRPFMYAGLLRNGQFHRQRF
jgi:hypothetical protein